MSDMQRALECQNENIEVNAVQPTPADNTNIVTFCGLVLPSVCKQYCPVYGLQVYTKYKNDKLFKFKFLL